MKRTHEIKTGGDGATRTAAMANDDNIYKHQTAMLQSN